MLSLHLFKLDHINIWIISSEDLTYVDTRQPPNLHILQGLDFQSSSQYFILNNEMISLKFTKILHKFRFCFQLIKITAYCYIITTFMM